MTDCKGMVAKPTKLAREGDGSLAVREPKGIRSEACREWRILFGARTFRDYNVGAVYGS